MKLMKLFGKKKNDGVKAPAGHVVLNHLDGSGEAESLAKIVALHPVLLKIAKDTLAFADGIAALIPYNESRAKARDAVKNAIDMAPRKPITNKELFNARDYGYYRKFDDEVDEVEEVTAAVCKGK